MSKIYVVGLGPGHPDYILPRAKEVINNSDIVMGGERSFKSIDIKDKETFIIRNNLEEFINFVTENYIKKKISIIVSGDPGFYSILRRLKKYFTKDEIEVIPGISSFQYMFSKISLSWEDTYLGSLHGRDENFIDKVKTHKSVCLLTDNKWTPEKIACKLKENNILNKKIFIGENLSYEDERIIEGTVDEILKTKDYKMSVVVISDV